MIVMLLQRESQQSSRLLIRRSIQRIWRRRRMSERFEHRCGRQPVIPLRMLRKLFRGEDARSVVLRQNKRPQQNRSVSLAGSCWCERTLSTRCAAACFSSCRMMAESMPSFCAASAANSSRWMRFGIRRMCGSRKFIAFTLASGVRAGKQLTGAIDEVIAVALRRAQCSHVCLDAVFANISIRIKAAFERDDLHLEVLFRKQRDGLFGSVCASLIGIEVDDDALRKSAQQAHLHLGKGRARGCQHIANPRHVDRDAIHLTFDQQRKVVGAHIGLGLVQIEEHLALRIERGLGRVHVLRAGLFIRIQCPRRERNRLALLIRNRKRNAFAEPRVELPLRPVGLFLRAEQTARPHRFFVEVRLQRGRAYR